MEDKLLLLGVGRTFVWRMYEFIQVSIKKKSHRLCLRHQIFFFFQFWRAEVQVEGANRLLLPEDTPWLFYQCPL